MNNTSLISARRVRPILSQFQTGMGIDWNISLDEDYITASCQILIEY